VVAVVGDGRTRAPTRRIAILDVASSQASLGEVADLEQHIRRAAQVMGFDVAASDRTRVALQEAVSSGLRCSLDQPGCAARVAVALEVDMVLATTLTRVDSGLWVRMQLFYPDGTSVRASMNPADYANEQSIIDLLTAMHTPGRPQPNWQPPARAPTRDVAPPHEADDVDVRFIVAGSTLATGGLIPLVVALLTVPSEHRTAVVAASAGVFGMGVAIACIGATLMIAQPAPPAAADP
jgi:hypothetical protein